MLPVIIARSAINITVLEPCSCSVTPKPWNSIEFFAVAYAMAASLTNCLSTPATLAR